MTIEGRPKFQGADQYWIEGPPKFQGADEYWKAEYARQRKDRMQDAIEDYLNDDKVDARQAYEEMLSCIDDVINYHKKQYDKAVQLKEYLLGYRDCDLLACADSFATAE
jgi:hypothetical protein